MSNPYLSPQPVEEEAAPGEVDRERLRRVARYQRLVMYALLGNIGLIALSAAIQAYGLRNYLAAVAALVAMLGIIAFTMVAIFLLMNAFRHPVAGVLLGITALVPCLALFLLLVINQYATNYLTDRGVRFGYLGADLNSI